MGKWKCKQMITAKAKPDNKGTSRYDGDTNEGILLWKQLESFPRNDNSYTGVSIIYIFFFSVKQPERTWHS